MHTTDHRGAGWGMTPKGREERIQKGRHTSPSKPGPQNLSMSPEPLTLQPAFSPFWTQVWLGTGLSSMLAHPLCLGTSHEPCLNLTRLWEWICSPSLSAGTRDENTWTRGIVSLKIWWKIVLTGADSKRKGRVSIGVSVWRERDGQQVHLIPVAHWKE